MRRVLGVIALLLALAPASALASAPTLELAGGEGETANLKWNNTGSAKYRVLIVGIGYNTWACCEAHEEMVEGFSGTKHFKVQAWEPEGEWSNEIAVTYPLGCAAETWECFTASNQMPGTERFGASSSPFNTEIGTAEVLSNSEAIVNYTDEHIGSLELKRGGEEGGPLPVVYASNKDPVVTLTASGEGNVNNRKVHLPSAAHVGETTDKHLTIVVAPADEAEAGVGEAIDLWEVQAECPDNSGAACSGSTGGKGSKEGRVKVTEGKVKYVNGGSYPVRGSLLEMNIGSVSAKWAALAGQVRAAELKAGAINHAIAWVVTEAKKESHVYPATAGDGKSTSTSAPPTGQRYYLTYSDAELEALEYEGKHFKAWKVAVLKAIHHYGLYLEDTGSCSTCLRFEGARMYEPLGASDPFVAIAEEQTVPKVSGTYRFKLKDGVDFGPTHLKAIAPPAH